MLCVFTMAFSHDITGHSINALTLVHTISYKFENAALFLRLSLQARSFSKTLIKRHRLCVLVTQKWGFRKSLRHDNHVTNPDPQGRTTSDAFQPSPVSGDKTFNIDVFLRSEMSSICFITFILFSIEHYISHKDHQDDH